MKILIVDDHPLFLIGLRHIFADTPGTIETLEATNFNQAFGLIDADPDIDWICLDLQLPGCSGFGFIDEMRARDISTPIVILTASEDPATVHRALENNVLAYLSKSSPKAELIADFQKIASGESVVSKHLIEPLKVYRTSTKRDPAHGIKLTKRQKEILTLVVAGSSNQAIAQKLTLAESTVKGHVSALYELLDVENRAGCTNRALTLRLID
jgi:DNA-binding NarL/FixJ family response regulator